MNIYPSIHSCRITGKPKMTHFWKTEKNQLKNNIQKSKNKSQTWSFHVVESWVRKFNILEPSPVGSARVSCILTEYPNFSTDSLSTRHGTALPFKFLPPKKQTDQQRKHHIPQPFFSQGWKRGKLSVYCRKFY